MVEEARLEPREAGLTPVSVGWFVVDVRDAAGSGVGLPGNTVFRGGRGAVSRPRPTAVGRPPRSGERYVALRGPGGLSRAGGRVPAARRRRGAATAGLGFRSLPRR